MTGAKGVIFAFVALGEAREPAARAQRAYAVATTRQNLVWIGLVPNVPDDAVARRVEHVMQSDRQFDHAKSGSEMPARHGNGVDGLPPQFLG